MEKKDLRIGINQMSCHWPSIWYNGGDMLVSFDEIDQFKKHATELANDLGMKVDPSSGAIACEDGGSDNLLMIEFDFGNQLPELFDTDAFKLKVIGLTSTSAEDDDEGQWQDYSC